MSVDESPDEVWRRPSEHPAEPNDAAADQRYQGPPASTPPALDWQPPLLLQIPPPRVLPTLDHDAIDDAEQRARWLTYGLGYSAVAVLLIIALVLALF